MSFRQRPVSARLTPLRLVVGLAAVGASITLVLVDESRDLRVVLCAVVAVAAAVFALLPAPAVTPAPALAGRRRPGTAWFGRALVVTCWLLRVAVAATAAGYITWNADSAAVQPLAAALVALAMVLVVSIQLGQHLAGFVTAVDELRGAGLARRAAAIVTASVTAGVSGYVAALVERFRSMVVDPVWEHAREEWGLPGFLVGTLVAVLTLLVVVLVASLVGVAMLALGFAVGPTTVLGRGLLRYSPVKYARSYNTAHVSVVGIYANFSVAPSERATRWIYSGVRDSSGPLEPVFLRMLTDDVTRAVTALAPPGGGEPSVVLRTVGDHEEVVLELRPAETRLLHDFPETAALRRVRLALHGSEHGLPTVVRCTPQDGEPDPWAGSQEWSTAAEEPEWFSAPDHEDLVKEVVRYPPGAPWVRERLGLPAVRPGW